MSLVVARALLPRGAGTARDLQQRPGLRGTPLLRQAPTLPRRRHAVTPVAISAAQKKCVGLVDCR